jgi:hypothetical protein
MAKSTAEGEMALHQSTPKYTKKGSAPGYSPNQETGQRNGLSNALGRQGTRADSSFPEFNVR